MMLRIAYPNENDIFQRHDSGVTPVHVLGNYYFKRGYFVKGRYSYKKKPTDWSKWQFISPRLNFGVFSGTIEIKGTGTFNIELKFMKDDAELRREYVPNVHIGEIFITCGQSNSANSGETRTETETGQVYSFNGKNWTLAKDPQPMATNDGGSPWPSMGDHLHKQLDIPIGIIAVGVGGSSVHEWLIDGPNFKKMRKALIAAHKFGVRAILWHQGESDAVNNTPKSIYKERLMNIIKTSHKFSKKTLDWFIARAAFVPEGDPKQIEDIVDAQNSVCKTDMAHYGPTTEDMLGPKWRHDNLHFNLDGLKEHGRRWAEVLMNHFFET